jgi:hypothetical protein
VKEAIAFGSSPSFADNTPTIRMSMMAVFVVAGLILLFAAIRILRRRHHHHHY